MDNKIDFIENSQVTQETVWGMHVEVSIIIHAHVAHQASQAFEALRVALKLTGNVGIPCVSCLVRVSLQFSGSLITVGLRVIMMPSSGRDHALYFLVTNLRFNPNVSRLKGG
jgi:hypothetical protein